MILLGYYSWYNVSSKDTFPWLHEIRDHVDPLLRIPKTDNHMALRQTMKKVYEQSLGGLRVSTGTYHVMPDEYDKLDILHDVLWTKAGVDMHYTSICTSEHSSNSLEKQYLASKYDAHHLNIYNEEFQPLLRSFVEGKQTAIVHKKLNDIIDNVKVMKAELVNLTIPVKNTFADKMQEELRIVLDAVDKEGQQ